MSWRGIDAVIDDVDRPAFGIWRREEFHRDGFAPSVKKGSPVKHGTTTGYRVYRCKCGLCRVAHNAACKANRERRKAAA